MIDLDDDGLIEVKVRPQDGGEPVEVEVDLYRAACRIGDLAREHLDRGVEPYLEAVADYMLSLGLPRPSLRVADRFAKAVNEAVETLKKKDGAGTTPGS